VEHILRYNPTTKKFFFGELMGDHRGVNSLVFDAAGPHIARTPRMLTWNEAEDCLDIVQSDGTTLQVGMENYIQIHNNNAYTLTNGMVVMFSGVEDGGDPRPTAMPYTANSSALPLYIIGVMTTETVAGGVGRATTFGKVHNLNTTGSDVGETWVRGDLLWAHPTMPGKMTRVQPTAPSVASSIAAVLEVHATDGWILVRPTIFPRLYFARFRDTTTQTQTNINTAKTVTFNQTKIATGFHIDPVVTSRIVAEHTGSYKFDVRLQFTSGNSSQSKIWVWYRVNGVDAEGTGTQYTIASNGGALVATLPFIVSMTPGDYFEIAWATDSTSVTLNAPPATAFCPSTPSAVIALTQTNL
jgi:hypothetical protein